MSVFLLISLLTALVTFAGSLGVWKIAHRFKLYPGIRERDVHSRPTPRLGGVAMFLGFVVAIGAAWLASSQLPMLGIIFREPREILSIVTAVFLIVVLGVADDIWDLDWLTKLAGQFLAAGLIAWQGVQILSLPIGGITVGSSWMSTSLTVIAIVLVMNAVNFIDGLDGLVAGISLIANGVFFLYTYLMVQKTSPTNYFNLASLLAVIVVGMCLGFLPLNWHPAKLFMGDAGALLIGTVMATSAIAVTGQLDPASLNLGDLFPAFMPIILPFAVLLVPLVDFALAVMRRLRAGKSPFSADRQHLHHRLLDMGHSHLGAVIIFYAWTATASVSFALTFVLPAFFRIPAAWAALVFVVGLVACSVATIAPVTRQKRAAIAAEERGEGELDGA
ncbi:MAG TPA: MraY family glycosyltransferase [Microbacteriaceae bacterium]|nr:MraY family glycosyltransferase [Microbacteriaceae bacterium]